MLIPVRNCTQGTCSRHCLCLRLCVILSFTTSWEVFMAVATWATCASLQWVWARLRNIKARRPIVSIAAILRRPNAIALTRSRAGSLASWNLQDITLRAKAIESTSLIWALPDTYSIHGLSNDASDDKVRRWWFCTITHLIEFFINLSISLAKLLIRISYALSNYLRFILFALAYWCRLILFIIRRPFLLIFENWVS